MVLGKDNKLTIRVISRSAEEFFSVFGILAGVNIAVAEGFRQMVCFAEVLVIPVALSGDQRMKGMMEFIHPFMDGNGRMGRFLMNVMLASGGYPWTIIPVEERNRYMEALEKASTENNIQPFAEFLAFLVTENLNGRPVASIKD